MVSRCAFPAAKCSALHPYTVLCIAGGEESERHPSEAARSANLSGASPLTSPTPLFLRGGACVRAFERAR